MLRNMIATKRWILAAVLVGSLALMAGLLTLLVPNGSREANYVLKTQGGGTGYGYFVSKTLEDRVDQAYSIALVTVEAVGPPRWNTPDGKVPSMSIQEAIQSGMDPVIYRPVTLRVEKYLKSPQPDTMLIIHQAGGELDGVVFEVPDAIGFQEGMRAIVFLARQRPPSPIDWDLYTVYVIEGDIAFSKWDQRSMPVDELLSTVGKITGETR